MGLTDTIGVDMARLQYCHEARLNLHYNVVPLLVASSIHTGSKMLVDSSVYRVVRQDNGLVQGSSSVATKHFSNAIG